ncbi:methyltransferase family protein [Luteimonas sp. e5]
MDSEATSRAALAVPAPWWLRLTSPVHFALALGVAWAMQELFALPLPGERARHISHLLGTVLANGGLLLALWCMLLFRKRGTTLLPAGQPGALVRQGPYRHSRNPMYLALLASYLGLALILDLPWGWLTGLPALWLLHARIIPFEEARMQARFGSAFDAYRAQVPRWL